MFDSSMDTTNWESMFGTQSSDDLSGYTSEVTDENNTIDTSDESGLGLSDFTFSSNDYGENDNNTTISSQGSFGGKKKGK